MAQKKRAEQCDKKKVIEETPIDIECECTETEETGESCSCNIVTKKDVKEKDECEDDWTSYERGKTKK